MLSILFLLSMQLLEAKIQKCLENEKETIQLTLLDQRPIQIDLILATQAAAKPNAVGGKQRVVSVAQLQQQQCRQHQQQP